MRVLSTTSSPGKSSTPVEPGPGPFGEVAPAEPLRIKNFISRQECDELQAFMAERIATDTLDGTINRCPLAATPAKYTAKAAELAGQLAAHYGLHQTSHVESGLVLYPSGSHFPEHTDIVDGGDWSYRRTVSFSVLLYERGADFTGGKFYANGRRVPLGRGDAVGFTARTPHSVTRITSGQRLVWIGFGQML